MAGLVSGGNRTVKNIQFEDLIYYKKLGSGMFGSVYLVKDLETNQFFALKCVSKQQVVEQNLEKHLQVKFCENFTGKLTLTSSKKKACSKF